MVPPTARPMAQLSGPPRPCHDRGRATRVGTLEHRGSTFGKTGCLEGLHGAFLRSFYVADDIWRFA